MGEKYLGCLVSIDCGDKLGYYQGRVSKVNTADQTLTLTDVFHNGLKSSIPETSLYAKDIVSLSIVSSPKDEQVKKREVRNESPRGKIGSMRDSPRKFIGYQSVSPNITPGRKNRKPVFKDDACFGASAIDLEEEFDFERNLALFDKKAVMGEIQASGQTDIPNVKIVPKFKHDENVLESLPPLYRQIRLPVQHQKEFLTGNNCCFKKKKK